MYWPMFPDVYIFPEIPWSKLKDRNTVTCLLFLRPSAQICRTLSLLHNNTGHQKWLLMEASENDNGWMNDITFIEDKSCSAKSLIIFQTILLILRLHKKADNITGCIINLILNFECLIRLIIITSNQHKTKQFLSFSDCIYTPKVIQK